MIEIDEYHVFKTSDRTRALIDGLARASRTPLEPPLPASHVLIGPRYATASLPDDDHDGWHWKCSCGTEVSPWIQNWPQSEDEAREEWRLHFE